MSFACTENLPIPPGAEIRWLTTSPRSIGLPIRGLIQDQGKEIAPSWRVLDDLRDGSLDLVDLRSTQLPGSLSNILVEAQVSGYNNPAIISQALHMITASENVNSGGAAILGHGLSDLWEPILDGTPFSSPRRNLENFCMFMFQDG